MNIPVGSRAHRATRSARSGTEVGGCASSGSTSPLPDHRHNPSMLRDPVGSLGLRAESRLFARHYFGEATDRDLVQRGSGTCART